MLLVLLFLALLLPAHTGRAASVDECVAEVKRILDTEAEGVDISKPLAMMKQLNETLHAAHSGGIEGNTWGRVVQQRIYYALAQLPCVQQVCETGFNGGHSAVLWLSSKPDISLLAFDLAGHNYTYTGMQFVSKQFPGRALFSLGSTLESLPNLPHFLHQRCDVTVVDGGHFGLVPITDMKYMRSMARPRFSIFLVDDYGCDHAYCIAVNDAVAELVKHGVLHILKSYNRPGLAFAVGIFINSGFGYNAMLDGIVNVKVNQ